MCHCVRSCACVCPIRVCLALRCPVSKRSSSGTEGEGKEQRQRQQQRQRQMEAGPSEAASSEAGREGGGERVGGGCFVRSQPYAWPFDGWLTRSNTVRSGSETWALAGLVGTGSDTRVLARSVGFAPQSLHNAAGLAGLSVQSGGLLGSAAPCPAHPGLVLIPQLRLFLALLLRICLVPCPTVVLRSPVAHHHHDHALSLRIHPRLTPLSPSPPLPSPPLPSPPLPSPPLPPRPSS